MNREEIQKTLETAYHEIGHAFAYVGQGLYISAQMSLSEANKAIHRAHDALDEVQDLTTTTNKEKPMQSKTTTDGSGEVIAVFVCAAGFVLVAWAAIGGIAALVREAV